MDKKLICPICNSIFICHNSMQKYCTIRCSKINRNMLRRNNHINKQYNIKCKMCGKYFCANNINRKFCNKKCSNDYYNKQHIILNTTIRKCVICNNEFISKTHNQKICNVNVYSECSIKYRRRRYQETRVDKLKNMKKWYNKNKEYKNRYRRELWKRSFDFRLNDRMRKLIWLSLGRLKNNRGWEIIVGYTLGDLKKHLEKQFKKDMSWENYGSKWHIDHIIPKSWFDVSNVDEFRQCWSLANLQPMWANHNISKGNKAVI